jgi:hypothetical protein
MLHPTEQLLFLTFPGPMNTSYMPDTLEMSAEMYLGIHAYSPQLLPDF